MIHSLVVAVDSTNSSSEAQKYAVALAKRFSASITGIAVLDTPWIKRPMAQPIGAGSYRTHRDESLIAQRAEELEKKIAKFEQRCKAASINARSVEVEGSPDKRLDQEAEQHDLFIIGRETNFHGVRGHDVGDATQQLLEDHPRPIIVVPPTMPVTGKGAVVSFDASSASSRALHMFYLLGLAGDQPVHVVSVDPDGEVADGLAARGAAFFKARGINAEPHGIQEDDDVAHAILHMTESLDVGMLAMGAFGEHGVVHQLLHGSTTKQLLRDCPVPLFVYY